MKNRRKNLWMSVTLMCGFLTIFFQFNKDGIKWFWTGQEIVPIVLLISTLIFGILWFKEYKKIRKG